MVADLVPRVRYRAGEVHMLFYPLPCQEERTLYIETAKQLKYFRRFIRRAVVERQRDHFLIRINTAYDLAEKLKIPRIHKPICSKAQHSGRA
jgi:hypothetical protein